MIIVYKDVEITIESKTVAVLTTLKGGFMGGARGNGDSSTLANAKKKIDNFDASDRRVIARHAREARKGS